MTFMTLALDTPHESVFYEDSKLFVALAKEPLTVGHSVVIWKDEILDINALTTEDYEYLMDAVDVARDTLREFYNVEKVYLLYLDEMKWVHWHLVPRYDEKGFNILTNAPKNVIDFPDKDGLTALFKKIHQKMQLEN